MKREERLDFISKLIRENEIKTQEDLVAQLLAHGIDVTQATISRDIKSLALIKVPAKSGGYRYDLPQNAADEQENLHEQLVFNAMTQVKKKDNMLSIMTKPGTTSLVKSYLLQEHTDVIFSALIDDDSVLVILEGADEADRLYQQLMD
jgi:transcriptional regulator of arginine metabolism